MTRRGMTVGQLAKRMGVSVPTLHHDEAIGLLSPAGRTEAGYRFYSDVDVVRLQQIRSLRQLGFGSEQIRELLDRHGLTSLQVIEMHLAELRRQMEGQRRLSVRLEGTGARNRSATEISVEDVLTTIEEMTRMETSYAPEQLAEFRSADDNSAKTGCAVWNGTGSNSSTR